MLRTNLNFWRGESQKLVAYLNSTVDERRSLVRKRWEASLNVRQQLKGTYFIPSIEAYERAEELRWQVFIGLAVCWLESNRDLGEFAMEVDIDAAIRDSFSTQRTFYLGGPPGQYSLCILGLASPDADDPEMAARSEATLDFLALITTPESVRFSRCIRCQRFYLARRNRSKLLYCPDRCGSKTTAAQSMKKKRDGERAGKIKLIQQVLAKAPRPMVAIRRFSVAKNPITKNFLTRVLNAGELRGSMADQLKEIRSRWDDLH